MKKIPVGALLFALVWALALSLPLVRELGGALPVVLNSRGTTFWANGRPMSGSANDPLNIERNLETDFYSVPPREKVKTLHQMDALAARFPDQRWLPAARLLLTVGWLPGFNPQTGEPTRKINWLSADELNKAAQIAVQASGREPDNAFWPWMETIFRMALRQKTAGIAALERASQKPRFDDYIQSTVRARLALEEKHGNSPWEHRVATSFSVLLPHLGPMRLLSRALASDGLNARKRGDNASALRIGAAILGANKVWRRDSNLIIGSLNAEFSGREAIETLLEVPKLHGDSAQRQKQGQIVAQKWSNFARAHNRRDLASRADWLSEPPVSQGISEYWNQEMWAQFGLPAAQGRFAITAPVFLFSLGLLCAFWALVWTIGALLTRRNSANISPTRGQVVACANFAFWALAGAAVVGFKTGWLFDAVQPFGLFRNSNGTAIPFLFIIPFVAGCWLLPVLFLSWKGERRFQLVRVRDEARLLRRWFSRARVAAWLVFGAAAFFVASNGRLFLWDDTPLQLPVSASIAVASLLGALGLELVRWKRRGHTLPRVQLKGQAPLRSHAPLALRLARSGAWIVAGLCLLLVWLVEENFADASAVSEALAVPLGLAATVLAIVLGRKIGRGDGARFRLATRSAGILSLAGSFVFLGIALAAWPLRVELNRQLDRRLSMREVDWMKEQLQKFPLQTSRS